jgi:hypothetical protein
MLLLLAPPAGQGATGSSSCATADTGSAIGC